MRQPGGGKKETASKTKASGTPKIGSTLAGESEMLPEKQRHQGAPRFEAPWREKARCRLKNTGAGDPSDMKHPRGGKRDTA